jgi:hypothetical protein
MGSLSKSRYVPHIGSKSRYVPHIGSKSRYVPHIGSGLTGSKSPQPTTQTMASAPTIDNVMADDDLHPVTGKTAMFWSRHIPVKDAINYSKPSRMENVALLYNILQETMESGQCTWTLTREDGTIFSIDVRARGDHQPGDSEWSSQARVLTKIHGIIDKMFHVNTMLQELQNTTKNTKQKLSNLLSSVNVTVGKKRARDQVINLFAGNELKPARGLDSFSRKHSFKGGELAIQAHQINLLGLILLNEGSALLPMPHAMEYDFGAEIEKNHMGILHYVGENDRNVSKSNCVTRKLSEDADLKTSYLNMHTIAETVREKIHELLNDVRSTFVLLVDGDNLEDLGVGAVYSLGQTWFIPAISQADSSQPAEADEEYDGDEDHGDDGVEEEGEEGGSDDEDDDSDEDDDGDEDDDSDEDDYGSDEEQDSDEESGEDSEDDFNEESDEDCDDSDEED